MTREADRDLATRLITTASGPGYVYDVEAELIVAVNDAWAAEIVQTTLPMRLDAIVHATDHPTLATLHAPGDADRRATLQLRRRDGLVDVELRVMPVGSTGSVLVGFLHARSSASIDPLHATIIDSAIEGICVCEGIEAPPGICISLWNPRMNDITGFTIDEVNRLGWFETIYRAPESQARAAKLVERVMSGERPAPVEIEIDRKDGAKRTVLISLQPLVVPVGAPKVFGVMHDITDRVALETRLRDTERIEAIGRLAGGVAHDFNNLLVAVLGGATLLSKAEGLTEADRQLARDIVIAAEQGADLTRQLLTFGRRKRAELRTVDVAAQITQTLRIARRLVDADIAIESSFAPDQLVEADPGMLDQVVMNLIVNARDAMPEGGTITVTVARASSDQLARLPGAPAGDHVRLSVADVGSGIAADALPHVFEPFFTTKGDGRGTGLGLATVFGIVKQHGGHITIDSAEGVGTSFHVFLPAARGTPAIATATAVPARSDGAARILLVDDMAPVRRVTARLLASFGYRVEEAASARDALAAWARTPFALVITDVRLGAGMSGPDLARALRARGATVPIVYISGGDHHPPSAPPDDNACFLAKPFTEEALAALVAEQLAATS